MIHEIMPGMEEELLKDVLQDTLELIPRPIPYILAI